MLEVYIERLIGFLTFWGIWLLAPLLIDISTAVLHFVWILIYREKDKTINEGLNVINYYPPVTIIIPVYNSASTLRKCLDSILNQSYPHEFMHIVCVNNGSQDNSFEVFQMFQIEHPEVSLMWTSLERPCKSIALNAGIYAGRGSYLINVDADTWLDRDAILHMVSAFENDPTLVAATGSIRIDKEIKGTTILDVINYCEMIEYLIAFDIGRRYQNITDTLFTLSGAFSAFRRDVLFQSYLYQERTVSEDTDLTFHIRHAVKKRQGRVGFVSKSIAYVEPIESLDRLYSQRARWQRGEVETIAMYYGNPPGIFGALTDFAGRILISDHTLAFSRLSWTFLIPFLYLLGYSLQMVMTATLGLFVCYMFLDGIHFLIAYLGVTSDYKSKLKKIWWVIFFLPVFRYLSYWFRLGGIILSVTEAKNWRVENPVKQTRKHLSNLMQKVFKRGAGLAN